MASSNNKPSNTQRSISLKKDLSRGLELEPQNNLFAHFSQLGAGLVRTLGQPNFFEETCASLREILAFDYFIIYLFEVGYVAKLIYFNLDRQILYPHMTQYEQGLYLMDPFYVAATSMNCQGVYRINQIVRADFLDSEFYNKHYKRVPISDELRYMVRIDNERWIHVFLERDVNQPVFSDYEFEMLSSLEPLVDSMVIRHWELRQKDETVQEQLKAPIKRDIRSAIGRFGGSNLTKREIDVVELMLKGYSSKSVADMLCRSVGTVNNHKRNIYLKLDVNSQGQLFNRFLEHLFG